MMRLFLAGLLAMAGLAVLPERGMAQSNHPYTEHGYGWFGAKVFRSMAWIHSDGPLYNYGPYIPGPGYTNMHIPQPYFGSYVPANYGLYNSWPNFGNPAPAPAMQTAQPPVAPTATVPAPAQPMTIPPSAQPPVLTPPVPQAPQSSRFRLFDRSRIVPANYSSVYPTWLTDR
ncbi:hypothetical protein [Zavarzinella formosa]|uniref:hypothetical protein n=1 Tax=Zavarzinella formosa TaxID=360055 RepID=UPI0002FAF727|nr:hypothetical protein [Zavarzinella formosa]